MVGQPLRADRRRRQVWAPRSSHERPNRGYRHNDHSSDPRSNQPYTHVSLTIGDTTAQK